MVEAIFEERMLKVRSGLRISRATTTLGVAAALLLYLASSALAADSVYWADKGTSTLAAAALDGSGSANLSIAAGIAKGPHGVAINPATNKIYWANEANNTIAVANLDGSGAAVLSTTGATVTNPRGVAINPATNKIYWANTGGTTIGFANLDGSGGGGNLNTTGATIAAPWGVTVDPAANKIYWANPAGSIGFANLDNTGGGGVLPIEAKFFAAPGGVAIDKATNKVFWANANSIGFANLDGSNAGLLNTTGAVTTGPEGVAVDSAANKVYWGNEGSATVNFANLDNTGGGGKVGTTGSTSTSTNFPALLKVPVGSGAPSVTAAGSAPKSKLSCTQGTWADNLLGSFLFRAPGSFAFQWLSGGQPVAGATSSTFAPTAVGSYSCRVTASNGAGATAQTSASLPIFKIGKAKLNKSKGTASLSVTIPGAGALKLSGKGVSKSSRSARGAGTLKLAVKAKGKQLKKLTEKGKLKVKLKVVFTPKGGAAASQKKSLTLKKSLG